jgi:uncharacterized protein (TIGR03084 family)
LPDIDELGRDLAAEHAALDQVVATRPDDAWATPSPAAGWDVRDCISHLCYFDESATLALTDPEAFEVAKAALIRATLDGEEPDVELGRAMEPAQLLGRWRQARAAFLGAVGGVPAGTRVRWYGPPMGVGSFVTARIMETWAHGQDVRDALGVPPEVSARLRHVVHLGVGARPFAFAAHGVEDPGDPIRVEAAAPDGSVWSWGPPDAANRVDGSALDLALLLTQRRHRSHTSVVVEGPTAEAWLAIAQAFAGAATVTAPDR